jgi:hypothetical protein
MIKRGKGRKKDGWIHDPLAEVRWKDVDIVLPCRVHEAKGRYQGVANDHEEGPEPHKTNQLAPS